MPQEMSRFHEGIEFLPKRPGSPPTGKFSEFEYEKEDSAVRASDKLDMLCGFLKPDSPRIKDLPPDRQDAFRQAYKQVQSVRKKLLRAVAAAHDYRDISGLVDCQGYIVAIMASLRENFSQNSAMSTVRTVVANLQKDYALGKIDEPAIGRRLAPEHFNFILGSGISKGIANEVVCIQNRREQLRRRAASCRHYANQLMDARFKVDVIEEEDIPKQNGAMDIIIRFIQVKSSRPPADEVEKIRRAHRSLSEEYALKIKGGQNEISRFVFKSMIVFDPGNGFLDYRNEENLAEVILPRETSLTN